MRLLDVQHDMLASIVSFLPLNDRLLRVARVCKELRDTVYAIPTAVTVYAPVDLSHLSHVDTVALVDPQGPTEDLGWLQRCATTLTRLELRPSHGMSGGWFWQRSDGAAVVVWLESLTAKWRLLVDLSLYAPEVVEALASVLPNLPQVSYLRLSCTLGAQARARECVFVDGLCGLTPPHSA